ncbi:hypothetical protein GPJ56_006296 [Histomonas meleagridis]|uniref:uncharacterized protein n=1 Tax=Histomonas meleagridis TaxID=135588 RepID=UPI00355A746B|nr:hypothetical protein GPJ56_006296 [Histomonas meleagridis]KAH0796887.1 hypothetical protein GO595_010780 [Histomonas meleagridis]
MNETDLEQITSEDAKVSNDFSAESSSDKMPSNVPTPRLRISDDELISDIPQKHSDDEAISFDLGDSFANAISNDNLLDIKKRESSPLEKSISESIPYLDKDSARKEKGDFRSNIVSFDLSELKIANFPAKDSLSFSSFTELTGNISPISTRNVSVDQSEKDIELSEFDSKRDLQDEDQYDLSGSESNEQDQSSDLTYKDDFSQIPYIQPNDETNNQNTYNTVFNSSNHTTQNSSLPLFESHMKFTDDSLNECFQRMLQTKELPPIEIRKSLIAYLHKVEVDIICAEDYDKATEIDDIINVLTNSLTTKQNHDIEQITQTDQQIEEYWNNIIQNEKDKEKKLRIELETKHQLEQESFRSKWDDEYIYTQYMKPSHQLLQIRKKQKSMALIHNFTEAKELKLKGDQLQKKELLTARKIASDVIKAEYQNLIEQQKHETQRHEEEWKRRILTLENEKGRALTANEVLLKQLQNDQKVEVRQKVTLPLMSASTELRVKPIISQRNKELRKLSDSKRLDVKVCQKSIIRPLTTLKNK